MESFDFMCSSDEVFEEVLTLSEGISNGSFIPFKYLTDAKQQHFYSTNCTDDNIPINSTGERQPAKCVGSNKKHHDYVNIEMMETVFENSASCQPPQMTVRRMSTSASFKPCCQGPSDYLDLSRGYSSFRRPTRWAEYPRRMNPNDSRRVHSAPDEFVINVDCNTVAGMTDTNTSYVDMHSSSDEDNKPITSALYPSIDELTGATISTFSSDSGIISDFNLYDCNNAEEKNDCSDILDVAHNSDVNHFVAQSPCSGSYGEECRMKMKELVLKTPMRKYYSHSAGIVIPNVSSTICNENVSKAVNKLPLREAPKSVRSCRSEMRLPNKLNDSFSEAKNNPVSLPSPSEITFPIILPPDLSLSNSALLTIPLVSVDANEVAQEVSSSRSNVRKANSFKRKSSKLFTHKSVNFLTKRSSFIKRESVDEKLTGKLKSSSEITINRSGSNRLYINSFVTATSKLLKTNIGELNSKQNDFQKTETINLKMKSSSGIFSSRDLLLPIDRENGATGTTQTDVQKKNAEYAGYSLSESADDPRQCKLNVQSSLDSSPIPAASQIVVEETIIDEPLSLRVLSRKSVSASIRDEHQPISLTTSHYKQPLRFFPPSANSSSNVSVVKQARMPRSLTSTGHTIIPVHSVTTVARPTTSVTRCLKFSSEFTSFPISSRGARTSSSNCPEDSFAPGSLGDSSVFTRSASDWREPSIINRGSSTPLNSVSSDAETSDKILPIINEQPTPTTYPTQPIDQQRLLQYMLRSGSRAFASHPLLPLLRRLVWTQYTISRSAAAAGTFSHPRTLAVLLRQFCQEMPNRWACVREALRDNDTICKYRVTSRTAVNSVVLDAVAATHFCIVDLLAAAGDEAGVVRTRPGSDRRSTSVADSCTVPSLMGGVYRNEGGRG